MSHHTHTYTHLYNHKIKHNTNAASTSNTMKFNDIKCPAPLSSPITTPGVGKMVAIGIIGVVDFTITDELLTLLDDEVVDVGATMIDEVAVTNVTQYNTPLTIFTVLNVFCKHSEPPVKSKHTCTHLFIL